MLARLFLLLVLALTSLPHAAGAAPTAAAACHEQAMPMPMPHEAPAPSVSADHGCIGCIPPGDWLGSRIATPTMIAAMPPRASVRILALGSGVPPALPPPRIA